MLSCPEAARLVLLDPDLLERNLEGNLEGNPERYPEGYRASRIADLGRGAGRSGDFWGVRALILRIVLDRRYGLWQRLFLVGALCRRLDGVVRGEIGKGCEAVLEDFAAAVESLELLATIDGISADLSLQVDLVLRLMQLPRPGVRLNERFRKTREAFAKGVAMGSEATPASMVARYAEAQAVYFEPFFRERPHILENLVVNAIFRTCFPFGADAGEEGFVPRMGREFALMATMFALIKGLLIGVAGWRRELFSEEDVVETVQSASRHFEHHPEFLGHCERMLAARGLDGVGGLTMLIRN